MAEGFDPIFHIKWRGSNMPEPQLSVRSARAREFAHELARREGRTIAEIVERALEAYRSDDTRHESAAEFYRRLIRGRKEDVDLDALLAEHRKPHSGVDL
jgi:hypothetical protein